LANNFSFGLSARDSVGHSFHSATSFAASIGRAPPLPEVLKEKKTTKEVLELPQLACAETDLDYKKYKRRLCHNWLVVLAKSLAFMTTARRSCA
jgi:hypothetical protein